MAFSDADFSETERNELTKLENEILADLDANADLTPVNEPRPSDTAAPDATAPNQGTPDATAPAISQPDGNSNTQVEQPQGTSSASEEPKPTGDVRAALRAARHEARVERRRREELEAEYERLRKQAGDKDITQPSDEEEALNALEIDDPVTAAIVKPLREKVQKLESMVAAQRQETAEPEFTPQSLPPETQAVIDNNPHLGLLEDWRIKKELQGHWEAAKAADSLLQKLPAWADKPEAERFAEVIRRVQADMGPGPQSPTNPPPDPKALAAQRIASAKEAGIETLSDLRGGVGQTNPSERDYTKMTDEQIIASL